MAFATKLGLEPADAQDATQETFISFSRAYSEGHYKRERGRLRSWLCKIAQNKVRDIYRRRAHDPVQMGDRHEQSLEEIVDEGRQIEIWEQEWRKAVIRTCLESVRKDVSAQTFAAFQEVTLKERDPEAVAKELGMSRVAVTKANRRVLLRMREMHRVMDVDL